MSYVMISWGWGISVARAPPLWDDGGRWKTTLVQSYIMELFLWWCCCCCWWWRA